MEQIGTNVHKMPVGGWSGERLSSLLMSSDLRAKCVGRDNLKINYHNYYILRGCMTWCESVPSSAPCMCAFDI